MFKLCVLPRQAFDVTSRRVSRVLGRHQRRNALWAALTCAAIVIVVEAGIGLYKGAAAADANATAVGAASELRARAESELSALIYLNSGLTAYISVNAQALNIAELRAILAELYRTTRHTQNFGLARGYVLELVYPEEGNQAALGTDYRDHPEQFASIHRAVTTRRATLSNRLPLLQGGDGVIYRAPIFLGGEYWGVLSTVIDIDSLLRAAFSAPALGGLDFAVRETDGSMLWGDAALFDAGKNPRLIGDHGWQYVVAPEQGRWTKTAIIALRVLGYTLALVLPMVLLSMLEHRVSLIRMSTEDTLTGLLNRRGIDACIDQQLDYLRRDRTAGFALVFIDLDQFKPINDTYGHRGGDAVLRELGQRLRGAIRSTDVAARWGGDEFAVFAQETRIDHLSVLIDRIRSVFDAPVEFEDAAISVAGSIGYAIAPADGESEPELIAAADGRMYSAKEASRRS